MICSIFFLYVSLLEACALSLLCQQPSSIEDFFNHLLHNKKITLIYTENMWGIGGNYYWRKKNNNGGESEAIVVVFAWMSSEERNLKNHVDLYSSLLWDSLVCHSQFLNMFVFISFSHLSVF